MKANFRKMVGIAASAAMMSQMMFTVFAEEIGYAVNDTFDKLETAVGSQIFDDCGWSVGKTSDDSLYQVNTAFGQKAAQPDMAYFSFSEGGTENGQQPNVRKDLANPIDITKGKVVVETRLAADSGIYGYVVGFELNRPKEVSDMSENAITNMTYKLFSLNGYTEGGQTRTSVYVRNKASETNYLDGYTKPEGSSFSRPVINYGETVTVKSVIDYANDHVDYYVTYPDGNTYTRTDGTLTSHDIMTSKEIDSIAVTAYGKGNASGQVNFWVEYVKVYQIKETAATILTDKRVDSDIKVTFSNAEDFANIDFANYVSLKGADGNEVSAVKTYENGVVTVNPSENLAAKAKYSVTIDKDALSRLACEYTGSDFSFTTLGENEYLNDTLTTTDACGWVGNAYADFPSSHWAGGDAACIKYKQASGQTEISPYSIQKDLLNPIDLTKDKIMIEADLLADTTNGLKINFNINKDENTTDDDALFRISGEGVAGGVAVRGNNGNLSKAYNPDMTVGATDNGRPTYSFTEKINVKALLSYSENNIKYYVTFAKDGVTRVYTRDGWNDQNNMTLSTGLPTEIRNVAFTASGANSKFWVENVKITKASQVSATVSNCDVNSVSIAFGGEKGDYSKYVDLYDAQNNAVEAEKVYKEETNEVEFRNVTLSAGNIYYVKIANVLLLSETECFYDGGTSKRFIPTNVGYQLTKIDSNKGTGAYFSADIKNCNATDKKVMAVIAEKDASGVLKNASVQEIDVAAGATEEIYVNFLNIGSDSTVEAYIWEKAAVKPIISKITVVHR